MTIEELINGFKDALSVLYKKYPQNGPIQWNKTLDEFLFGEKGLYEMFKQQLQSALWEQELNRIDLFEQYRQSLIELIKQQNNIDIQNSLERLKREYWS